MSDKKSGRVVNNFCPPSGPSLIPPLQLVYLFKLEHLFIRNEEGEHLVRGHLLQQHQQQQVTHLRR